MNRLVVLIIFGIISILYIGQASKNKDFWTKLTIKVGTKNREAGKGKPSDKVEIVDYSQLVLDISEPQEPKPEPHCEEEIVSRPNFSNWAISNNECKNHINIVDAWTIESGKKDVVVAVIDTGVDSSHPDIKKNLWKSQLSGQQVYGWDFNKNEPNPEDNHGHGTHIAGIIGGSYNERHSFSGVAQNVSLMILKYYDPKSKGPDNLDRSIKAIHFAIDNGAKIINYSGGGPEFSQDEWAALKRAEDAGILIVAAAGNESENLDEEDKAYYPAEYKLTNILSVAASDKGNNIVSSSNWGKRTVHVAAPGERIKSLIPINGDVTGSGYGYMTGTSQATAVVTGIAALILSKDPSLTPQEVKKIIINSSDKFNHLSNKLISSGRVNAHRALQFVELFGSNSVYVEKRRSNTRSVSGNVSNPLQADSIVIPYRR